MAHKIDRGWRRRQGRGFACLTPPEPRDARVVPHLMDLNNAANLAEILGAIIVVGGFAFAIIQLAHFRAQRRDTAALELARSVQNPEFAHALRLILSIPPGLTADELRAKGSQFEDAAMLVSLTLESVGIMIHRRIVSIDMVWELMGGMILETWDRIELWVRDIRRAQEREKFDEWIEWLVHQMNEQFDGNGHAPAHVRYAEWKA
jgi:uncharacterized membrane protein YagU involved in acid resistance